MKKYEGALKVGLKLIYDGDKKSWCDPRTGKVNETMGKGRYVITCITNRFVYVTCDRKNAVTEHQIERKEVEGRIYAYEWADLTSYTVFSLGQVFGHHDWYYNDTGLIEKARAYNKRK